MIALLTVGSAPPWGQPATYDLAPVSKADDRYPTPQAVLEVLNQERLLDPSRSFVIGLRAEEKARMAVILSNHPSRGGCRPRRC